MIPELKITEREDYIWFRIPWRNWYMRCCNCHLIHRINHKLVNGKLFLQAIREDELTKQNENTKNNLA
jgi:hypothetical protein